MKSVLVISEVNTHDRAISGKGSKSLKGESWAGGEKMILGDEISGGGKWV